VAESALVSREHHGVLGSGDVQGSSIGEEICAKEVMDCDDEPTAESGGTAGDPSWYPSGGDQLSGWSSTGCYCCCLRRC